jgi:hypothetical protein
MDEGRPSMQQYPQPEPRKGPSVVLVVVITVIVLVVVIPAVGCLACFVCAGVAANVPPVPAEPHAPVHELFSGTASDVSQPMKLYRGTAIVSVAFQRTEQRSIHIAVRLTGADGSYVSDGLVLNEAIRHDDPILARNVRKLVRISRTGDYIIGVETSGQHINWGVTIDQE